MLAYGNGDDHAFTIIYERHKGALYRYLLRQCGNAEDARELFQDIWMNLIRARERYEVRAKFVTYLFRLAHNRLVDHYRRRARNPVQSNPSRNPGGEDDYLDLETLPGMDCDQVENRLHLKRLAERLLELIGQLPYAQREAFLLREEAGFSLEEIAEVTGVNAETAKSRLRYAVVKLRNALGGELGEER